LLSGNILFSMPFFNKLKYVPTVHKKPLCSCPWNGTLMLPVPYCTYLFGYSIFAQW
jgi:hypothetical protein